VCAKDAIDAQVLRGHSVFGAVVYCESGRLGRLQVIAEQGYADCLPVLGGGFWRDPAKCVQAEVMA